MYYLHKFIASANQLTTVSYLLVDILIINSIAWRYRQGLVDGAYDFSSSRFVRHLLSVTLCRLLSNKS